MQDDDNEGAQYVTNVMIQGESGSLGMDAYVDTIIIDGGMTLELTFHSEANDELPYSTKTLFSHMMTEDGDDGKTIAVGFEEMMRSKTSNMTDRPVSKMVIGLPFKARKILKKEIYPCLVSGVDIVGLRSRCSSCHNLDMESPSVEAVSFLYVRIEEDRQEIQRAKKSNVANATFSPNFKNTMSQQRSGSKANAELSRAKEMAAEAARNAEERTAMAEAAETEYKNKAEKLQRAFRKGTAAESKKMAAHQNEVLQQMQMEMEQKKQEMDAENEATKKELQKKMDLLNLQERSTKAASAAAKRSQAMTTQVSEDEDMIGGGLELTSNDSPYFTVSGQSGSTNLASELRNMLPFFRSTPANHPLMMPNTSAMKRKSSPGLLALVGGGSVDSAESPSPEKKSK